jgi:hypothetical protein
MTNPNETYQQSNYFPFASISSLTSKDLGLSYLPTNSQLDSHSKPQDVVKARKESHKEVERRRRAAINEGIQNLANLIPGGEKNKGRIIQKAADYIQELQRQQNTNMEKWGLEKMLFEQAYELFM